MTETEACVALNLVSGLGPRKLRKLLETFETPQRVLQACPEELRAVHGIGPELARAIAAWESEVDLPGELRRVEEFGARLITRSSPEYPPQLKQIHNPPILLYVWGTLEPRDHQAIGIVGSRHTSAYGLECAKKLSYQLAYAGLTVVSGLARGIDTAAHQGAVAAQGRTIGVIGSGLMDLYPPENAGLAEKIAAHGAVVSEFPMRYPPSPQTFPYRNRIVAGWGSGVLVVEAGLKSGAIITANLALEQGRLVYAVPGPINLPTSQGTNRLIQTGAKLVMGAGDILDDLQSLFPTPTPAAQAAATPEGVPLSPTELTLVKSLPADGATVEDLREVVDLPPYRLAALLLSLEMKRVIKQVPGSRYVRLSS